MSLPRSPLWALVLASGLVTLAGEARAQAYEFQAGGLAPPPPGTGPGSFHAQPTETERLLREADEADSGRGLEVAYFDIEGGGQYLSLEGFGRGGQGLLPSTLGAPEIQTSGFAPIFGAGAGVRLLFLTVGPRFRLAAFEDFTLWSLGGEAGFHIPLGNLEPYVTLGAGYTKVGSATDELFGEANGPSIDGFDVRLAGGADYYLTEVFSIGARASFEALFLKRAGVDPASLASADAGPVHASSQLYAEPGSGTGFAATASVVLGLHF